MPKFGLMLDFSDEIKFKTARSGGKGGQNVNKVETMVEGYWHIPSSVLITLEQKEILQQKLANKINSNGFLLIKSQVERTQLGNKQQVLKKMTLLVNKSLIKTKTRKATKPSKLVKEKRKENKIKAAEIKTSRKKITIK